MRQVEVRDFSLTDIVADCPNGGTLPLLLTKEHRVAIDANAPVVLTIRYRCIVCEDELDRVGPVVLATLGATPQIVPCPEVMFLE